mmetsp:Transcript_22846/g.44393  ORF Transcript_22846/g.44393 Transcript_22846/m.44393 type:complete len:222 (-) Transcript_22846:12-677(-)
MAFRLLDLVPDLGDVSLDRLSQRLDGGAPVPVAQHEEQEGPLRGGGAGILAAVQQPHVDLEHGLEEREVGGVEAADLMHPHVDHHDVGQGEAKERTLALECLLLLLLPPVGPLHVEHQRGLPLGHPAPDALGGLLPARLGVHGIKARAKHLVQQRALAAALPPDDPHNVELASPVEALLLNVVRHLIVVGHIRGDDLDHSVIVVRHLAASTKAQRAAASGG